MGWCRGTGTELTLPFSRRLSTRSSAKRTAFLTFFILFLWQEATSTEETSEMIDEDMEDGSMIMMKVRYFLVNKI